MNKGIKKLYWHDVRKKFKSIDPFFSSIVDEISPDSKYPVYQCYYNYGDPLGDHRGTFIKTYDGENSYRLGDKNTPKEILNDLGYGVQSSPLLTIMNKNFEWHIIDKTTNISFPIYLEKPGFFVGRHHLLNQGKKKTFLSSSIMSCYAGAKSAFLLPNIGNTKFHSELQKHFGILASAPKSLQDHWEIFKEISSKICNNRWQAEVLFFSKNWVDSITKDKRWDKLREYLLRKMLNGNINKDDSFFYDFAFSRARVQNNIENNDFLNETAKHIYGIAMGLNIGFSPATDNSSLPLHQIQEIYINCYNIKQTPIIIEPAIFDIHTKSSPIYYSIQNSIIKSFVKQTKTEPRALSNISTLRSILTKYQNSFKEESEGSYYHNTTLKETAEKINFSYFHYSPKNTVGIQSSDLIFKDDTRFLGKNMEQLNLKIPIDAKFLRGCVRVSKN